MRTGQVSGLQRSVSGFSDLLFCRRRTDSEIPRRTQISPHPMPSDYKAYFFPEA